MAGFGFWAMAAEDPGQIAVVEPDGTETSAGELLTRANRLVHGLRSLGLGVGDAVATVLPNGAEFYVSYLACLQAGWYLVPINHHLVGPEIAYIVENCEAKALIGHERFAGRLRRGCRRGRARAATGAWPSAKFRVPVAGRSSLTLSRPQRLRIGWRGRS